ncbi:AarF/ABC1/UbiB kinase family protein [Candidatus Poribacteria bacterium]|nr:AarF/ABC1/UbiB kinase family protein [Candidatus Poribacteria bacterium]
MRVLLRPIRVFLTLLPFIVSFLRDWQGWILFGAPRTLCAEEHRSRARRLTRTLADLGPAFIKGAQVLGMREDLLPRAYTEELKTLQDRVPPFPVEAALRTIHASLGRPASEIFDSFDETPLAAASLGQVHRAVHKGRPVAVKILRPGIEEIVEIDLRVVSFIIKLFHFFIESHFIRSFWAIHNEYTRMIRQEMDFRNEERYAARFRRNFKDDPRVLVPECHSELTSRRTVAFEYVDGARVDQRDEIIRRGVPPVQLVDKLIEIYVRMAIVHGFIHADPHPGNLLVDGQGRLVLLDYGMALDFPDEIRKELLRGCLAVVRNRTDDIVDCFYRLKMVDKDINRSLVRDAAETLLNIQLRRDFTPRMVQEIADDILQTFHKFPLRMPQQLVYLFRASALVEGLGMMYDPHFSGVREATPIIKRLIREIALDERPKPLKAVRDVVRDATETVKYLHRVIVRFEREEQRIRIHQVDLNEIEGYMASMLRRLLLGISSSCAALFAVVLFVATKSFWLLAFFCIPSTIVFLLCLVVPLRRRDRLRGAGDR